VGAGFVAAFADDEEVKEFLLYLTSPGAGRIWVSTGTTVSPNKRIPLSAYPNELVRTAARQVSQAKVVRFDGSDLLPGSLDAELGLALQGVMRRPADTQRLMVRFQRMSARVFNG
jgi:alpha-glucoside transport system substrate-binding protein